MCACIYVDEPYLPLSTCIIIMCVCVCVCSPVIVLWTSSECVYMILWYSIHSSIHETDIGLTRRITHSACVCVCVWKCFNIVLPYCTRFTVYIDKSALQSHRHHHHRHRITQGFYRWHYCREANNPFEYRPTPLLLLILLLFLLFLSSNNNQIREKLHTIA